MLIAAALPPVVEPSAMALAGVVFAVAALAIALRVQLIGAIAAVGAVAYSFYRDKRANDRAEDAGRDNRRIALAQADDARERGKEEEAKLRKYGRALIGAQRAAYAAQGVVLDEGSPLEVMQDTADQVERDALTLRKNAMREAWGYEVGASNYGDQVRAAQQATRESAYGAALQLFGIGANAYADNLNQQAAGA